ncbi:dipeptide transporter [Halolamina pelagica]|uniref:Dipeptide transporter n=1 Tax=Halolamina pelagica TaxID=699431 RepID=A0A0P7HD68_9EURY|nr:ABC transporter permease [Halolamina pelagica]KPN31557.1 dipeptide transporter [Halolamina pelagica]
MTTDTLNDTTDDARTDGGTATVTDDAGQTTDAGPATGRIARSKIVFMRVMQNRFAVFGLGVVVLLLFTAIFADFIAPYEPAAQNYEALKEPPSLDHPFGTDQYGRDVFSRVVYGSRYAVFLGVVIVGIEMALGVTLGLIAGYYGGLIESTIMRVVDIALSMPALVLALAIAGMLGVGCSRSSSRSASWAGAGSPAWFAAT